MAEQYTNRDSTTVAAGGYTPGSNILNVANTAGANAGFPVSASFRVTIYNHLTGEPRVTLKVTGINSSTQFAVEAEGDDAAAFENNIVRNVLTAGAIDQIKTDILAATFDESDLDTALDEFSLIGTYAALPSAASVKAGAIYRQTDGPYVLRSNGSAWTQTIPGIGQVVIPPASGWSWGTTQGTASVDQTDGALTLACPGTSGDNVRVYERTPGGATFTIEALLDIRNGRVNFTDAGISLRENGSGKIAIIGLCFNSATGGSQQFRISRWTNATTFSADVSYNYFPYDAKFWIKVVVGASTIDIYVRAESGGPYVQVHSESLTTFFTTAPDRGGIVANNNSTSIFSIVRALSFSLS